MNHSSHLKRPISAAALMLIGAFSASAQNFQGLNLFQNIASGGQSVGTYIVNIVFVFSGIVAVVALIPAGMKALRGDPTAKDSISGVGIGALGVFITLFILKSVMGF